MASISSERGGEKAFLDTTVPCDRVLGSEERRESVNSKLDGYGALATSRFVQLEFALGPYGHLVSFQAKAEKAPCVADLHEQAIRYATLPPPLSHRRVGRVVLKAINFFIRKLEHSGPTSEPLRHQLRAFLRRFVRGAWRKAFCGVNTVLDPPGCLGDLPQPRWSSRIGSMQNVASEQYATGKAPQLAAFIRREAEPFKAIVHALERADKLRDDQETQRRIKAINKILDGTDNPSASDVRNVGDAFVAVECPEDHVLLNNNAKHFDPITRAIGKQAERSF